MESLTIHQEIGNRSGIAKALQNLGITYSCLCQYQKSIEYYQQALAIQQELGECHAIARCLNDLGNAYYSLEKYSLAIEHHQQSLAIREEISDRSGIVGSLHNLGNVYLSLGEYQQAIEYYKQSLEIQHEIGTHSIIEQKNDLSYHFHLLLSTSTNSPQHCQIPLRTSAFTSASSALKKHNFDTDTSDILKH